jgi:hypothetical protein
MLGIRKVSMAGSGEGVVELYRSAEAARKLKEG